MSDDKKGYDVLEHSFYQGMDDCFGRVQQIVAGADNKNRLTMMVLELDSALSSFKNGDKDTALGHYKNFIDHSHRIQGSSEVARNANLKAEVREVIATLMTGVMPDDQRPAKPWSEALRGLNEERNKRMTDVSGMQLAEGVALSTREERAERRSRMWDETPQQPKPATPAQTVWARPEYKALARLLTPLSGREGDNSPYRKDVLVAMICLRNMNNCEKEFLRGGVKKQNPELAAKMKEYRNRLSEYIDKMERNPGLPTQIKKMIEMPHKAVDDHARHVEKTFQGSILRRAFAWASSIKDKIAGVRPQEPLLDKSREPKIIDTSMGFHRPG